MGNTVCLVTEQESAKIATRDMVVFKLFNIADDGELYSPYIGYRYKAGKQPRITLSPIDVYGCGTTYFATYFDEIAIDAYEDICSIFEVREGYHSATTRSRLKDIIEDEPYWKILKCIIPSGSSYFEDVTGLIVSSDLIIPER